MTKITIDDELIFKTVKELSIECINKNGCERYVDIQCIINAPCTETLSGHLKK